MKFGALSSLFHVAQFSAQANKHPFSTLVKLKRHIEKVKKSKTLQNQYNSELHLFLSTILNYGFPVSPELFPSHLDLFHNIDQKRNRLRIHVATWNVNEKKPPQEMDEFLGLTMAEGERRPDVVIIGLQEIVMSIKNFIKSFIKLNKWTSQFDKTLTANDYYLVHSQPMFGINMYVYVLRKHQYAVNIADMSSIQVPTGFGGALGNKGGVVINFRMYDKVFSLVNSHLPAHDEGLSKRIEDYKTIDSRRSRECSRPADYLFWLGDLNFRTSDETILDAYKIQHMISKGQIDELLEKDQLKIAKENGDAFVGWQEDEIHFKPTFKFVPLTSTYNLKRRPSWTDRILFKSETDRTIRPVKYTSLENYMISDHKPVIAQFFISIDTDIF